MKRDREGTAITLTICAPISGLRTDLFVYLAGFNGTRSASTKSKIYVPKLERYKLDTKIHIDEKWIKNRDCNAVSEK